MTVGMARNAHFLVIARSKATRQSTHPLSLRGAKRRGNPYFRWCRTQDGLLRLRLAMTVGMARNDPGSSHCEEQSDVAIHPPLVIARSKATRQSTHPLSLRGAKRRGNPYFRQCRTEDGLLRLRLAMTLIPVIARSVATRQSIFQVVQDSSWIASPPARNDSGDGS